MNVDEYIASYPKEIQKILTKLRETIKKAVPGAKEMIAYRMPAYKLNGKPLVYFAAFKNHIGFYPTSVGVKAFQKELAGYKCSKGSVQFPLNKPLPFALIEKIVQYRASELVKSN